MKGRKNISKLIPVKRPVTDKKTGTTYQQTYYIKPEEAPKHRTKKADMLTPVQKAGAIQQKKGHEKKHEMITEGDGLKKQEMKKKKSTKNEILQNVKDFDDFGRMGIDPDAARTFFCRM